MSRKLYVNPPPPAKTMAVAQIVLFALFLPLGIGFVFVAEGEARPFVGIFALIWTVACIALIVHARKVLRLVKSGKFEMAELDEPTAERPDGFAARLRAIEALKKDGLLSEDEFRQKRAEILQEKW